VLVAWIVFQAVSASGQETLARAKELYGSAAYDEALEILDSLQVSAQGDAAIEIGLYRVFCLLVLERSDEASKVIESMVTADPFYVPAGDLTSPRIRSVFLDARRALLPSVVQRMYADAKEAFGRKDPAAAVRFDRVIALLDDPDLKKNPALADLRTIASEFRDLSKAMTEKAAAAVPVPAAPKPEPVARAGSPSAPTIAREGDPGVTAPVVVSQSLPQWTPSGKEAAETFAGLIEVIIDERGNVTAVRLIDSVHPSFDQGALRLAPTWKFKPATRNGVPTAFLKLVRITLQPPS
jgi:TonB family protein